MIYKLLALNIDGTLLQNNGKISKATKEAIDFARNKDVKVVITTSQNFITAKGIARALKLEDHLVAHQGGYIGKEIDKAVFVKRIPEKITLEVVTFLETFPCQIRLVHEHFSIENKLILPDSLIAKVLFQRANRSSYSQSFVDSVSEELRKQPISPLTIKVTFEHQSDCFDAKQALKNMYDEIDLVSYSPKTLDIVPKHVSKLSGVQFLCNQYFVKREEVVAIGSDLDDKPLIEWAGLGVAMGNAPQEVKDEADWITRSNEENGVAYMVKEHFRKQYKLGFLRKLSL